MLSAGRSTSDNLAGPSTSVMASNRSHSDYDPSINGDEKSRDSRDSTSGSRTLKKPRWFSQVKDWLSVSEPSAVAMKEQKRVAFKKHGIDPKDPRAAAKMHLPIGKLPEGAITSTRGPSPEKALKLAQEQNKRQSYSAFSQDTNSMSSSIFSVPTSPREPNLVAPWET
ncbi:hypothetical protein G7Z17_g13456 [Cylindrodendrum hubeiense]|uniref:Uncharacterized protein n=1 Tax=Cylindrodendrum hubeiense TaxID=595255 RepID=A0A9P5GTK0_9HYPO|nr:hypothetical protein G7Z17_g13456 [Cylindrodendrum hubeiense]